MKISKPFLNSLDSDSYLAFSLAGTLSALGFSPFGLFFVYLFCFGWLFAKITAVSSIKKILLSSFVFFISFYIVSLYWLVHPLTINLEKHWFLIPFAAILIPAYLSAQLLIPVFVVKKFCKGIFENVLAFSALFSLMTYFYGHYLPGFPWGFPGYIWSFHATFLQSLSVFGIYGLNFVTVLVACLFGAAFVFFKMKDKRDMRVSLYSVVAVLLLMTFFGALRLSFDETQYTEYKARLVQCNISQRNKMCKELSYDNFQKHISYSYHRTKLDFIIWPEACIPYLYHEAFTQLHDYLKSLLLIGEHLIAGAVRKDLLMSKIYNSVVIVNHLGHNVGNYDKVRLVPFGEYIPFREYLPFQSIANDIGDFDIGCAPRIIEINGLKTIMAICYEAVFPQDFIPKEGRADVIINITNDAWFGFTTQPFQHLQIVRARAIENGLPLIRATNYGISAVFDAFGREIRRIPINHAGFIDFYIPKNIPNTPYGKFGDLCFFFFVAVSLIYSFRRNIEVW